MEMAQGFDKIKTQMNKKKDVSDIHIITDAATKFKIKSDAAAVRLSISQYCLDMIGKGKVESPLSADQRKLLMACAQGLNNLNQISKKLNQGYSDPITIAMAEESIFKINELLNSIQKK